MLITLEAVLGYTSIHAHDKGLRFVGDFELVSVEAPSKDRSLTVTILLRDTLLQAPQRLEVSRVIGKRKQPRCPASTRSPRLPSGQGGDFPRSRALSLFRPSRVRFAVHRPGIRSPRAPAGLAAQRAP